jgi:hypothetical protein
MNPIFDQWIGTITTLMRGMQMSGEEKAAVPLRMLSSTRDVLMMITKPGAFEGEILNFRMQNWPFHFEWHPVKKIVYIVREPDLQAVVEDAAAQKKLTVHAEAIAFEIGDHGAAQNAVLVYMRGFNEGRARLLNEQVVAKN